jgi:hypothetical protein
MISKWGLVGVIIANALVWCVGTDNESSALRFLMLGDWGKHTHSHSHKSLSNIGTRKVSYQPDIAKSMASYCSEVAEGLSPCSFIIALGNNFYENGVWSSTDSRRDYVWKDVYHGVYSILNIPWYPVLGNGVTLS